MDSSQTGEGNSEDAVIILQQQQGEGWAEVGPMETTPKARKKGQPREMNLTAQCLICNGPAAAHQHYGAVCCYSCRAFFRRGITRSYVCVRGDDLCQVNSITRTNCKRCRYARCLAVGMKPELVDATLKRKQEERRRQEMVELQQEMGIQVSNQQQHRPQPRNGVQQLLQAQQVLAAVQGIQHPHSSVDPLAASEQGDRPDEALLYQALEGKKKVLLELRQDTVASPRPQQQQHVQEQFHQQVEQHQQQQVIHQAVLEEQVSLGGRVGPVRQQTYYIFHPPTQTFEPITIAEFEEQDVIEEVVVAEDYSLGVDPKQEEEEQAIAVVNEHDYVEVPVEGGEAREAKRPRLSEEEAGNNVKMQQNNLLDNSTIKVDEERKPVLLHQEVKQEVGQVSVIRRLLPSAAPPQQKPTDLGRVIQDTIGGDVKGSIVEVQQAVQQIQPQPQEVPSQQPMHVQQQVQLQVQEQAPQIQVVNHQGQEVQIQEQNDEEQVDIEKLVDFCFEEEMQRPNIPKATAVTMKKGQAGLQGNVKIEEVIQQEEVKEQDDETSVKRPKVIQRVRRHTSGKKRRQSGSPLPLKKRRKMHHYPIALAINRQQIPSLAFTIEEEFRLHDLVVRNDHIQTMTHQELMKTSPETMERMVNLYLTSQESKIRIQEADMDKACNVSRELFASKAKEIFDEFHTLKRNLAYRVQYTNWPALQCIQFATFLANKEKGLRNQIKFCGISDHLYEELAASFPQLKKFTEVNNSHGSIGLGLENYDMFASPWALTLDDELFFEKTLKELGSLLGEDLRLMVVFQMLVMATQPPCGKPMNKKVKDIQGDLAQLLYRYLSSKLGTKLSSEIAYKLTGFINKMHRCGDIFMNRRIKMLPEEESSTSTCTS